MKALIFSILLQWKLNFRSKEILVHFYVVPLIFYVFIGSIFISINPQLTETIVASMTVFGVSMGGILGSPYPLVEFFASDCKKSYHVQNIPLSIQLISHCISGFIHLSVLSIILWFTAPLLFDAVLPTNLPVYFSSLALLILASLGIGMIFGLFFKSASKMSMATQIVFLPSLMLSGIMFPADMLPAVLQNVGKFFPASLGFSAMTSDHFTYEQLLLLLIFVSASLISMIRIRKIHAEE